MSTTLTGNEPIPAHTTRSSRNIVRPLLLIAVPLVALVVGGGFYLHGGRYIETENAYVKADKVPISADVAGSISAVMVQENQQVAAGDLLFRIDPQSFQLAVDMAHAHLGQVRADLLALKAGYEVKQAEIKLARTKYGFANKNRQRQATLVEKNFVSRSKFDDATEDADVAAQQITALEQDLQRIVETLGGDIDAPVEMHPTFREAEVALETAELDLKRTEVRAPVAGIVSKLPKPGQYLVAGSTALALVVNDNMWVEANFTETDLTHMHEGQPVSVHIDTYPDDVWTGTLQSLSPATGAEFSVIPAQNATGNWVKITQRLPVRIALATSANQPTLRAGLSATVEIDTGFKRHLFGYSF
jgi:membrane fusion protein, multidrug efflux system